MTRLRAAQRHRPDIAADEEAVHYGRRRLEQHGQRPRDAVTQKGPHQRAVEHEIQSVHKLPSKRKRLRHVEFRKVEPLQERMPSPSKMFRRRRLRTARSPFRYEAAYPAPHCPHEGNKGVIRGCPFPPRRYVPCKGSSYFPNTPFFTGQKPCHALRATWHASLVRTRIILTRTNWQEKFLCAKIKDASP